MPLPWQLISNRETAHNGGIHAISTVKSPDTPGDGLSSVRPSILPCGVPASSLECGDVTPGSKQADILVWGNARAHTASNHIQSSPVNAETTVRVCWNSLNHDHPKAEGASLPADHNPCERSASGEALGRPRYSRILKTLLKRAKELGRGFRRDRRKTGAIIRFVAMLTGRSFRHLFTT